MPKESHFCVVRQPNKLYLILSVTREELEKDLVELMSRVTVVPDNVQTPYPVKIGGKIKERSMTVFCTGDALKAITVSANRGFFSSAKYQGKEFVVWLHDSRALTELKQSTAKPLPHA
uniref:DUF1308 domain-containing protein n=1 Tax=Timema douglasi TaxID=61478 RepID=A0A7R8Z4B7_TIMDO|nr:unnamed protein product [Timema douglasi]